MPVMKSIRVHAFGEDTKQPGDKFDATEREAALLKALGWAVSADEDIAAEFGYSRRDLTAEAPAAHRQKRQYRRRDLTAQKQQ